MKKNEKITRGKNPITIREKELSNGNKSLYLDIYKDGNRHYEFLKLYLIPECGTNKALARQQNKNTYEVAEAIKAKRYRELLNDEAGIKKSTNSKLLLRDWLKEWEQRQEKRGRRKDVIVATLKYIDEYIGGKNVTMKDVDKKFCLGFINYIKENAIKKESKLKASTAKTYCITFSTAINEAVREEIINVNPFSKISKEDKIKTEESTRGFLSIEEVKGLIETKCSNEEVKRAFLFSCFCGLRVSDVMALKWKNIEYSDGKYSISITMQKTKDHIYLPLSTMAMRYLPGKADGEADGGVFKLPTLQQINIILKKWGAEAGIKKNISFHVSRHTFATLNLISGVDLYTTSKLLGHKDISTTTIYAKIINKKREAAVIAVSNLFD